MKKVLVIIAFAIAVLNASAISGTVIPSGYVSGTWTTSGSPYQINGDITIQDGAVLTIQPGVVVNFQGQYYFRVIGQIIAQGTSSNKILFTAPNTTVGWRGLKINNSDNSSYSDGVSGAMDNNGQSKLIYCDFKYGKATSADVFSCYENGGALFIKGFSNIIVDHCSFENCEANLNGGAIFWGETDNISITNCQFTNTTSNKPGGAIKIEQECENITISGNSFNNCQSTGYHGGAVQIAEGCINIEMSNNNIVNCHANVHGGGLFFGQDCQTIEISGNTISGCSANNHGGAIHFGSPCTLVTMTNNILTDNSCALNGGGIHFGQDFDVVMNGNKITNNTSDERGGGLFFGAAGKMVLTDILIVNNTSGTGGGIFMGQNTDGTITNVTIANNLASFAGGLFLGRADPDHVAIISSIIWGNTASVAGPNILGGYCHGNDYTNPSISSTDLQGGKSGILFFTADPSFSDGDGIPDLTAADTESGHDGIYSNNLNADPQFTAPSSGSGDAYDGLTADWTIASSSPCRSGNSVLGYLGNGSVVPIPLIAILASFGLIGFFRITRRRKAI